MAYEVISVGARCAGSPLAMPLAGKGYRVLMVDKAASPSDAIPTYYLNQPGVERLARWGPARKSGPIKTFAGATGNQAATDPI